MNNFFSKLIVPSVLLGGFGSVALSEPAAAKRLNACQVKHSYCSERCIMNYDGGGIGACIHRTCDRQHPGCGGESIYKGGRRGLVASVKQPGPVASGPQTPRETGKTEPFNPGTQGPFGKTGPFAPGGMKPNGGVVSGGVPNNGGIVPSGPTHMSSQGRR